MKKSLGLGMFSLYAVAGVIGACLAVLEGVEVVGPRYVYQNPEYAANAAARAAFDRHAVARRAWLDENRVAIDRREFDEALAGVRDPYTIGNWRLRACAASVRTLLVADPRTTPVQRAAALRGIAGAFVDDPSRSSCGQADSSFRTSFIDDSGHVAELLRVGASAIAPAPVMPEALVHLDRPPSAPPLLPPPRWFAFALYVLGSLGFALGFCGAGLIAHRAISRDFPHPLTALPKFMLGWMVMLAAFPGFLMAHLARLLVIDAGGFAAMIKARVSGRSFASEYAKLADDLVEMRQRAESLGDTALAQRIGPMLERVRAAQDFAQLAQLRETISNFDDFLTGVETADRIAGGRPTSAANG